MILEEVFQQSKNSESKFKHKGVLFIGSESYDAPTITIIQGLEELGFDIYVIKKSNINSWFCNKVISDPAKIKFDFVLSNLHWGTRWNYYNKFNLFNYPKILIDGDDNRAEWKTWRDKYNHYRNKYTFNTSEDIKIRELAPFRWIEPLGKYKPDLVFTSQKLYKSNTLYLPFGLQREYFRMSENKSTIKRKIDFIHVPGPGKKRKKMKNFLFFASLLKIIPGKVVNRHLHGEVVCSDKIKDLVEKDNYVHTYFRWLLHKEYFKALNNAKVLIYPGIHYTPQWDSKRPWEAYASGCLVLMSRPNIDVSEYPITEICPFAVYDSYREFIEKCRYLYKNQPYLDKLRLEAVNKAIKYFSPAVLARYFLSKIYENIS